MSVAATALQEEHIPYGGIADFIMSDAEIAELEREEAKQFGTGGIANFEPIAQRMASYGRYGDDTVAHVETGELIVPRALIDQSPALKESIFEHLREMGVEDPERYVVGSGENSLNPETGMPEFFLKKVFKGVRRAVSSVAKGVSKAVSQVGKVLKKVAPLVLPVVLTPILGPIYAGAVGAGIGSLIQGKSIKESLRAALVGAGTGAVFAGAKAKLGGGTFTGGIREAAANPGARFSQLGQAVGESVTERSFSPLTQKFQAPTASAELEAATGVDKSPIETTPVEASSVDKSQIVGGTRKAGSLLPDVGTPELMADQERFLGQGLSDAAKQNVSTLPKFNPADLDTRTFLQKSTDTIRKGLDTGRDVYSKYLSPSRNVLSDADQISRAKELVNLSGGELTFDKALERVVANTGGNIVTNYAPLAGIAGLGAYAGGFFDAAPQDDPDLVDQTTGAELIAQNPDDYMIQDLTPRAASQPFAIPTRFTQLPPLARQLRTSPFVRPAAKGGAMFPRRTGGIDPNEGTPGEDSVRALLMPGEFVMTTDAVRGAGNGSLNQGINNMYSMMRNFESKGRVA
jgi:hypothetical protein